MRCDICDSGASDRTGGGGGREERRGEGKEGRRKAGPRGLGWK